MLNYPCLYLATPKDEFGDIETSRRNLRTWDFGSSDVIHIAQIVVFRGICIPGLACAPKTIESFRLELCSPRPVLLECRTLPEVLQELSDGIKVLYHFSKKFASDETFNSLIKLAKEAGFEKVRCAMVAGENINFTENRAVLHAALHNFSNKDLNYNGKSVVEGVNEVLQHMKDFTEQVRSGEWKGYTDKKIKSIIYIGIGGWDLGPVNMVLRTITVGGACNLSKGQFAEEPLLNISLKDEVLLVILLEPGAPLKLHFVSNIDGIPIVEALPERDAETTFLAASKTFTTSGTCANLKTAKSWFLSQQPIQLLTEMSWPL
ncbi:glucose-6-phosphate isomerase [Rhizina undulata]